MGKKGLSFSGKRLSEKTFNNRMNPTVLTDVQEEVLHLLINEFLTPKQISIRRQTSHQNINQIIAKIRRKGYLSKQNITTFKKQAPVTFKNPKVLAFWRYHKLHFVIRPYYIEPRYNRMRKESGNFGVSFGDWVFKFHQDMVEVQLKALVDFKSLNKWEALSKAERSFTKYVGIVSNKFGFRVFKDNKANIKLVDQHLACTKGDFAKSVKEYIRIVGSDGKFWFLIDESKGDLEYEYVHSDLAVSDSEKLEPYLNSIRHYDCYPPHTTKELIDTILKAQMDLAVNMKRHVEVMDKIDKFLRGKKR